MNYLTTRKIAIILTAVLTFAAAFVLAMMYGLGTAQAHSEIQGPSMENPTGEHGADSGILAGEDGIDGEMPAIPTGEYPVNDMGLTYGPAMQSVQHDGVWPDLVLAKATNGIDGYVYLVDLRGTEPANPEEAGRMTEAKIARESLSFTSLLYERLGLPTEFDSPTALFVYETAKRYAFPLPDRDWSPNPGLRNTLIRTMGVDSTAMPEGEELQTLLIEIAAEARNENLKEIPVYESDGITQIGVFATPG
ncbi:MAG: hypothetical protein FWD27_07625 [Coriobacteriia bacterium]|nr:hypothetical protein [Coriobacteriia bacterium]